jgi:peptide/nickel transport system permease protein
MSPAASSRRVWLRFRSHPLALVGAALLAALVLLAASAPWIAPYPPAAIDLRDVVAPPSPAHPLGTDELGRDVLARVLYGGRVTLPVGVCSMAFAVALGTVYGAVAGLRGGRVDALMMRGVDLLLAFPAIFVLLIVASVSRVSVLSITLYIGLTGWMGIARLARAQVRSLRERDFVVAVRSLGAGTWRTLTFHLVPNAAAPLIVAGTLGVGGAMLVEAALDFLGLGVAPDTPTWGNLLNGAELYLTTQPLLAVVPGLLITVSVLSVSFIGDALRDALDPYSALGPP